MPQIKVLIHHGIDNQKWGVRNGPPYPLAYGDHSAAEKRAMEKAKKKYDRLDAKFAQKKGEKIKKKAEKAVKKDMEKYVKKELDPKYENQVKGKRYMTEYSQELAKLMNMSIGDVPTPSGKVIRFVAKRGEMGVYIGIAGQNYNMNQVKNGVYGSGKIAYKNTTLETRNYGRRSANE